MNTININTSGNMHEYDMNKQMYYIIDSATDSGFVAFCSTIEKARDMAREYCADNYDSAPEYVENVWIEDYELDTWANF